MTNEAEQKLAEVAVEINNAPADRKVTLQIGDNITIRGTLGNMRKVLADLRARDAAAAQE